MTGDELRAKRTELRLFQANLAQQIQALGDVTLDDGNKIGQPEVSQMERGKLPVPAALAAAIAAGRITPGGDEPPPVGQQRAERPSRAKGKRRGAVAPAPEPAPEPVPETSAGGETGTPGAGSGDVPPQPVVEQPRDTPPASPALVKPAPPIFDEAARSQLERDLRDLFAGQRFLVPMVVGHNPDGSEIVQHHEGIIPGVAQLAGMLDERDGRVIELHATAMARAWADLAQENATVRRFLIGATYGGAWRGVIAATLPVIMAIAANHGMALPGLTGPQVATVAPAPDDGHVVPQL